MHSHRIADPPAGVARPGSPEFEHQRRVVLEVAVDPPPDGTSVAVLAADVELTAAQVDAASAGLERAGLVERRAGRLRPTLALRALETLWPIGL
jgi:hypothetical protein